MPACSYGNDLQLNGPSLDVCYTSPHIKINGLDLYVGVSTDKYHSIAECGSTRNLNNYIRATRIDLANGRIVHSYWYMADKPVCIGSETIQLQRKYNRADVIKGTGVHTDGVTSALNSQFPKGYEVSAASIVAHLVGTEYTAPLLSVSELSAVVSEDSTNSWNGSIKALSQGISRFNPTTFVPVSQKHSTTKLILDNIEYTTDKLFHNDGWADTASVSLWRDTCADVIVVQIDIDLAARHGRSKMSVMSYHADWSPILSTNSIAAIYDHDIRICQRTCTHILRTWCQHITNEYFGDPLGKLTIIRTPSECTICINDKIVSYMHAPSLMMYGTLYVDMI